MAADTSHTKLEGTLGRAPRPFLEAKFKFEPRPDGAAAAPPAGGRWIVTPTLPQPMPAVGQGARASRPGPTPGHEQPTAPQWPTGPYQWRAAQPEWGAIRSESPYVTVAAT